MTEQAKVRPTLFAFLSCEKVLREDDGLISMIRVADTFTASIPRGLQLPQDTRFLVTMTLVTYWGNGRGEFEQRLDLLRPDGKVVPGQPQSFVLSDIDRFHYFITDMQLAFRHGGEHRIRLHLNGEPVAELPFKARVIEVDLPPGQDQGSVGA